MNFHFKQALEYLKTPEGKAESILREVIDSLRSKCVNEIISFHFYTYTSEIERYHTPNIASVCFAYRSPKDVSCRTFRSQQFDLEEAILILKIIKNQLTEEGYECIPTEHGFSVNVI